MKLKSTGVSERALNFSMRECSAALEASIFAGLSGSSVAGCAVA